MRFITSVLAIVSKAEQFKKETKKRNGKAYNGFITFDVNEEAETVTMTATDGDVTMNETLYLVEVEGSFKFEMHIKRILDILGCMSEKPIEFYVVPVGRVCFNVVAECGMLVER